MTLREAQRDDILLLKKAKKTEEAFVLEWITRPEKLYRTKSQFLCLQDYVRQVVELQFVFLSVNAVALSEAGRTIQAAIRTVINVEREQFAFVLLNGLPVE